MAFGSAWRSHWEMSGKLLRLLDLMLLCRKYCPEQIRAENRHLSCEVHRAGSVVGARVHMGMKVDVVSVAKRESRLV